MSMLQQGTPLLPAPVADEYVDCITLHIRRLCCGLSEQVPLVLPAPVADEYVDCITLHMRRLCPL